MTKALEQAVNRLRELPEQQQDDLAKLLLHEIEQHCDWADSTAKVEQGLRGLIDEVIAADDRGECEPLDADTL